MDLWNLLIKPMFEMVAGLFYNEGVSNRNEVFRIMRKSFKGFTLLKRNIDDITVETMMNYDFEQRAIDVQNIARIKWEARKRHSTPDFKFTTKKTSVRDTKKDGKVFYPKEIQEFLNLLTAPICKIRCSARHMLEFHNIFTPTHEATLSKCKEFTNEGTKLKLGRKEIMMSITRYIKPFIDCIKLFLNK